MSNIAVSQATKLGQMFGISGDGAELVNVLKATAFKGQVSDAQMTALMLVANQHKLNPFTKEIYAFPDKNNGIVPVVGVDGWSRIINEHPQFDGMEATITGEGNDMAVTVSIYRKDRSKPTTITEYFSECKREAGPWKSHPKRMLRHKGIIQCARLAFGFAGIFDQDEAERIAEVKSGDVHTVTSMPIEELNAFKKRAEKAVRLKEIQDIGHEFANAVLAYSDAAARDEFRPIYKLHFERIKNNTVDATVAEKPTENHSTQDFSDEQPAFFYNEEEIPT